MGQWDIYVKRLGHGKLGVFQCDSTWDSFLFACDFFSKWASLKQHVLDHYFISKLGDLVALANLLFKGRNMHQFWLYEKVGYMVYVNKHNYIPTCE
jgi:hypothetical protein